MSKKRFTESAETFDGFCDILDNGVVIACMRKEYSKNIVNLLNSLSEENEQLQKRIEDLENVNGILNKFLTNTGLDKEFMKWVCLTREKWW